MVKRILLILCILLLSINTVSAALVLGDGVEYLEFFENDADTIPDKMVYDYGNSLILYTDSTNGVIKEFVPGFPAATASTSTLIINLTEPRGIALTTDGHIVFGNSNGDVYRVEDFNGLLDWDNEDHNDYFTHLTQIDSSVHDIVVDENDNIYVSGGNKKIWKISQPYYTVSQLDNVPTSTSGSNPYYNIDIVESGFILGFIDSSNLNKAKLYNVGTQSVGSEYFSSSCGFGYESPSTVPLSDGNFIIRTNLYASASDKRAIITHVNTTDSSTTEIARYTSSSLSNEYFHDLTIDKDGIIYASLSNGGFYMFDSNGIIEAAPFAYGIYPEPTEPTEDPGINTVEWGLSEYASGDTASLNVSISNVKWDTANYTYYLNIYDHASLKDTQTFTEQNSTKTYTFEPAQIASSFLAQAKRQHTDGTVETLASGLTSFVETGASYAVTFDKDVYATSETITMLYSDAPANTTLYLQGWDEDTEQNIYENTWTVSGSGSESLTVPNPNAESYTVRIIKDGYILDSDYSEISAATESHLYGVVYNAATGARIESAEVSIDDTYKLTDEIGAYSWVVETGEHDLSCALDGFQTISYDDYMISGDKEVNFYLSPNAVGDSVYVMVKDYETKAPIQYAHVIISNDTWSMGDYSSNTGLVELAAPDGTYTLKVIKDGYDNIEKTIDTSASSFFDVLMASGSYNPNAPGAGGLAEDESLTDYYNARFREFAPTAWGFFLLVIVLYLLSILTSFGGSKSRR